MVLITCVSFPEPILLWFTEKFSRGKYVLFVKKPDPVPVKKEKINGVVKMKIKINFFCSKEADPTI